MSEKETFDKRYILRVAVNLFSISFEEQPFFGGEIDQIDSCGECNNLKLSAFCNAFVKAFETFDCTELTSFIKAIDSNAQKRLVFFRICCDIEISRLKQKEFPIIFYWSDFFDYCKHGNVSFIIEQSKKRSLEFLKEKPQMTIFEVKKITKSIIEKFDTSFRNVKTIILYGSLAKGSNCNHSDIDLLVIFEKYDPLNKLMLKLFCDEFTMLSGQKPDLNSIIVGQSNRFIEWILGYGKVIYSSSEAY